MTEIHGLNELFSRVLDKGLCAACGACVGGCPYLTSFKGKTVMVHSCSLEQGRCFAYCPMTFFDPDEVSQAVFRIPRNLGALGQVRDVMASRATDDKIASKGQAGGTVSALLVTAFEEDLIDAVVLTSLVPGEEYPRGIVATSVPEVLACAGSKYVGAHSLAAVRDALNSGYERIGVVGLPCQVRSVRKMALYDIQKENLAERIGPVIGLFCNWAFSSREFNSFLSQRFDIEHVEGFHIPPPPANCIEIVTREGRASIPLDEVRPLIQAACQNCEDMTSEFADLSVGMYEGKEGWNTLITRTDVGRNLVERAVARQNLETDTFPEPNLSHLKEASLNKRQRPSVGGEPDS
ncbi:MAG: Coenzyme F420 hydrogenase/dehydrogenase, beta subunit C-terminal domain [Deltaproteobacteria bacterium]